MELLSTSARDYFAAPRHIIDEIQSGADIVAVTLPSGEIFQLQLQISPPERITAARFKAYGCAWLIACGALLTERLSGSTRTEALQLDHHLLVELLDVPPAKLHCAVLVETALTMALARIPSAEEQS